MGVFHRNIDVAINPLYQSRNFLSQNWQWLFGLLFGGGGGLVIWVVRCLRSRGPTDCAKGRPS
ncbi:MAG TPA: hypothetical protein VGL20_11645 [Candidatus Dormibacteraeota bacterium]